MTSRADIEWLCRSGLFDESWYLATYRDVADLSMTPAAHFLRLGMEMGRRPAPDVDAQTLRKALADHQTGGAGATLTFPPSDIVAADYVRDSLHRYDGPKDIPAGQAEPLPLVSFIVTAFNGAETITASVQSLVAQTYPRIEIVICDDASTDQTWAVLQTLAAAHPDMVRVVRAGTNGGTYLARNIALTHASGDIILFQDADDHSHRDRAMIQVLALLENRDLAAVRCEYLRFDPATGRAIEIGGKVSRIGLITLAVWRAAFADIGYFEPVRKAGDDEWVQRLIHLYGKPRIKSLNVTLYMAELRVNSLVADMLIHRGDGTLDQVASPRRKAYVTRFQTRFGDPAKTALWYRAAFPPNPLRPVGPYIPTISALLPPTDTVAVILSGDPDAPDQTRAALGVLAPQADEIHVCYPPDAPLPVWLKTFPGVILWRIAPDTEPILASLRFRHCAFYVLNCDARRTYRPDHARTLLAQLRQADHTTVITAPPANQPETYGQTILAFHSDNLTPPDHQGQGPLARDWFARGTTIRIPDPAKQAEA